MVRFGRVFRRRLVPALVVLALLALGTAAAANAWAQSHYDKADRSLREDRLDDARAHIQRCLQVWRRSPAAHFLAARIERRRGDYPAAEAHLDEYKRLQPRVGEDWQLEWVLLRAQRGELDDVELNLWNCVRKDHPDTLLILETLSRAYMRHQRFLPALQSLNEWLKRRPDTVRALEWRGWVYQHLMAHQAATTDYRRVLELDPDHTNVRLWLADILLDDGDPVEAGPHVEWLQRTHPDRPDAQLTAARYHLLRGNLDEARRLLDRALAARPNDPVTLCCRGKLELDANRPVEAESWLRKALKADPFLLTAHNHLATSLRQQGNRDAEAAAQSRRHEALRADSTRLAKLLGGGQVDRAPNDARVPSEIGAILLRTGQVQYGLYWLEQVALGRDPDHVPTHEILARYFDESKQSRLAARHRKAVEDARQAHPSRRTY